MNSPVFPNPFTRRLAGTMPDFDPDERFSLPDDTDPDDVLKRLLGPDGDGVSYEPEDPEAE